MSAPPHDEGRPRERAPLSVNDQVSIPAQMRRRREAANRCAPLGPSGYRDPMDALRAEGHHIVRGGAGDCCLLCGRCGIDLDAGHACRGNLPPNQLERLLAPRPDRGDIQGYFNQRSRRPGVLNRSFGTPQARLVGILRTVQSAATGQRNATLHWAACRVAEMVRAGEVVDVSAAAEALAAAAECAGLPSTESRATIRSGFSTSAVVV
jgi:hypothetical protein